MEITLSLLPWRIGGIVRNRWLDESPGELGTGSRQTAECVAPGRWLQGHHPPPVAEPFVEVHGLDARGQYGAFGLDQSRMCPALAMTAWLTSR